MWYRNGRNILRSERNRPYVFSSRSGQVFRIYQAMLREGAFIPFTAL
jgi:hypothetical protein